MTTATNKLLSKAICFILSITTGALRADIIIPSIIYVEGVYSIWSYWAILVVFLIKFIVFYLFIRESIWNIAKATVVANTASAILGVVLLFLLDFGIGLIP